MLNEKNYKNVFEHNKKIYICVFEHKNVRIVCRWNATFGVIRLKILLEKKSIVLKSNSLDGNLGKVDMDVLGNGQKQYHTKYHELFNIKKKIITVQNIISV